MNPPLISVIIPTKNRRKELKRALESVLKQSYTNFEVLVVDDKSEEDIQKLVNSFQDDRVLYFLNNKNISNANVCRNIGIEHAKGEYVAMLDSDDEWLPEHLELGLKYLIQNDLDGVFGGFVLDDGVKRKVIQSRSLKDGEKMVNYLLSDGMAVTPSQIYKSSCCKSIFWDEELRRHQDYDFSVRFAEKFRFQSSGLNTCVVNWRETEGRSEHYPSLIKFISKNISDISPMNYHKYHGRIYCMVRNRKDVSPQIIKHYKRESLRHLNLMYLDDYITLFGPDSSRFKRLYLRIEFCFKLMFF